MRGAIYRASIVTGALALSACASAPVHLPDVEEYVYPAPEPGTLRAADARRLDEAWREIVRGRAASADKTLTRLQALYPRAASLPAGAGYARLRAGRLDAAREAFLAALKRNPAYLPALAGAAAVALRQGDADAAVDYYRRAAQAGPETPSVVRRRLGEAKLKATEAHVQAARRALDQGQPAVAASEYRAALKVAPEVSGVRLDLADLLVGEGDAAGAMEALNGDPSGDRLVALRLGAILSGAREPLRAAEVYERLAARDPGDQEARRLGAEARRAAEFLQMPEEYRHIFDAPRVTRADLAALVAVKLTALARLPEAEPAVATDISGSWARGEILRVLARGVMDVFPNHTFQPASIVKRGELAQVVARVLDLTNRPKRPAPILADLSQANLYYDSAAEVVAEGLMDLTPDGRFEPWRPVTGTEAVATIEALARSMSPPPVSPAP